MALSVLPLSVLYLEQHRMTMYTSSGRLLTLDIPKDVVSEFEIVSREKLSGLIKDFINSKEIDPSTLIVIYAPELCFEKNFPELPLEQKEGQTQAFFEAVPFDRVLSRVYPDAKGSKAVAINRDFYEVIYDIFSQFGFQFYAVIPFYVLTLLGYKGFDAKVAGALTKRSDAVKQQTMILIRQPVRSLQEQEELLAKEHTPLILLIFFVFIAAVVGVTFIVLNRQAGENRSAPTALPTLAPASVQPTAVSSPSVPATSSAVRKESVSVRILSGPDNQQEALALSAAFSRAGFTSVVLGTSQATRPRTLITVSAQVSSELKQEIVAIVTSVDPDAFLQENGEVPELVTIDMGR